MPGLYPLPAEEAGRYAPLQDWHRHTVTAFLGKLVALNYLTVDKTPEGFSLLLNDLFIPDL